MRNQAACHFFGGSLSKVHQPLWGLDSHDTDLFAGKFHQAVGLPPRHTIVEVVEFTAHIFRDAAFTRAWDANIPLEKAAIAIDCNPPTVRKHYVFKNKIRIADEVFDKLNG